MAAMFASLWRSPAAGVRSSSRASPDAESLHTEAIQVAHVGDCSDLDAIERVLERGTYAGMDRYGLDIFCPSRHRNRVVADLCARGYADRLMLGHDSSATLDWYPPGVVDALAPRWRSTLLSEEEIPALTELGVRDEQIETMLVANPARWLAT